MKRTLFFVLALSAVAHADDKSDARSAYERGTAAYQKKDYATAAAEYARADVLAPNPVALQAALDASVKADDPVIGSELLERAMARRAEGPLAKSIEAARARFAGKAGRVTIVCMDCSATLDGAAITTGTLHWARVGTHAVVLTRSNSVETKNVEVDGGGAIVEVSPTPPPPATDQSIPTATPTATPEPAPAPVPDTPKEAKTGISPVFFFVGVGVTVGLGIASIAVGADTDAKHQAFVKAGCPWIDVGDCRKQADAGSTEQIAASALIGGTIAFGAATILSIFFVQWKSPVRPTAAIGPSGGWAGVSGSF